MCRLLCCFSLSLDQVKLGDALLLQFCRRTERLFGTSVITPNMHMHGHLYECILDYGPLHGFWLFAFERFNVILGAMPNNNRNIESQIMEKFLRKLILFPTHCHQNFMIISFSISPNMFLHLALLQKHWHL